MCYLQIIIYLFKNEWNYFCVPRAVVAREKGGGGNAYKDAKVFAIPPTNYAYKNNATLNMCERIAVK